jgi:5-(carboxyamino)imidazole ribonucleotide mutase
MGKIYYILGSKSDMKYLDDVKDAIEKTGIDHEVRILSAHRNLKELTEFIKSIEDQKEKVIVGIAGYSAALPGILASLTISPVIGVPVSSSPVKIDALMSMVQMPKGNPVAVMSYDKPGIINATIFALKIFSMKDDKYLEKIEEFKKLMGIG